MSKALFFNDFNLKQLRCDFMGGITAAIVSLPLALAFGAASGAGPEAGLYGAIIVGLFAALFGGTPTLISEPTGPMTVVMTAVVASMIAANPENGLAMAFTVVMIAGAVQILLGSLRLGHYLTLMPYSVISGFMSGIGVILIVMQLPTFLGNENVKGNVAEIIFQFPALFSDIHLSEMTLGLLALAILFFTPTRIKSILPAQLIALVVATLISLWFFSSADLKRIGSISFGLPSLHLPTFTTSELQTMLVNGLMLGALGCIDSLLTAVISDSLTRQQHRSDKELIGQGIANTLSGLFGGLPGAGATMGTVVNIQAGARSAWSGVIRALSLLVFAFGASQLVQHIPMAVLAAIALYVGINILDWSFVKRAHRISKPATFIMYSVLLLTVFVDLIVAVGIGMFIANLITVEKLSNLQKNNIQLISDTDDKIPLKPDEKILFEKIIQIRKTLLVYLSGPMIFGVSNALRREAQAIDKAEALIVDLSDVSFMDATMSLAIENMLDAAIEKHVPVVVIFPEHCRKRELANFNAIAAQKVCIVGTRQAAFQEVLDWQASLADQPILKVA